MFVPDPRVQEFKDAFDAERAAREKAEEGEVAALARLDLCQQAHTETRRLAQAVVDKFFAGAEDECPHDMEAEVTALRAHLSAGGTSPMPGREAT